MELSVLNSDFQVIGIVDVFESLIWAEKFKTESSFELYSRPDKDLLELLTIGNYAEISESKNTMVIEGKTLSSSVEEGPRLQSVGRSLSSILDRRIVWGQTVLDGPLQSEVRRLLMENVIAPENPDRRIDNFIFEESLDSTIVGMYLNAQFTGTNLLTAIRNICERWNLGFRITLNENKEFVFKLYAGVDRSYDQDRNSYVVFSPEYENLLRSEYIQSSTTFKNAALVAGEGEGFSRKTRALGYFNGLGRNEIFVDARDISSNVEGGVMSDEAYGQLLHQRGFDKLVENNGLPTFIGELSSYGSFMYGRDFYLGDVVQVVNEYGIESRARVMEFVRCQDLSGYTALPTFETF